MKCGRPFDRWLDRSTLKRFLLDFYSGLGQAKPPSADPGDFQSVALVITLLASRVQRRDAGQSTHL
jgi:hypothetical protein